MSVRVTQAVHVKWLHLCALIVGTSKARLVPRMRGLGPCTCYLLTFYGTDTDFPWPEHGCTGVASTASLMCFVWDSCLPLNTHPEKDPWRPFQPAPRSTHSPFLSRTPMSTSTASCLWLPASLRLAIMRLSKSSRFPHSWTRSGRASQLPWTSAAPSSPCLRCSTRRLSR